MNDPDVIFKLVIPYVIITAVFNDSISSARRDERIIIRNSIHVTVTYLFFVN